MQIPVGHDLNADQIAYWNGPGGQRWADRQQTQDVVLAPISEILIDRAKAGAGERIIDIGCGCGTTSVSLAQQVGPGGHVLGIDISAPCWHGLGKSRRRVCLFTSRLRTQPCTLSSLKASTCWSRGSE